MYASVATVVILIGCLQLTIEIIQLTVTSYSNLLLLCVLFMNRGALFWYLQLKVQCVEIIGLFSN